MDKNNSETSMEALKQFERAFKYPKTALKKFKKQQNQEFRNIYEELMCDKGVKIFTYGEEDIPLIFKKIDDYNMENYKPPVGKEFWECSDDYMEKCGHLDKYLRSFKNKPYVSKKLFLEAVNFYYLHQQALWYQFAKSKMEKMKGGDTCTSIYDPQKETAEQIYQTYIQKHPELIEAYHQCPKKRKPNLPITTLKKMILHGIDAPISDDTALSWAKQLLETDGHLKKTQQLANTGLKVK